MGGSFREWKGSLPPGLAAGGPVALHLVMTKFGPPAVEVAYQLRLEP